MPHAETYGCAAHPCHRAVIVLVAQEEDFGVL
jgi:hypothetical protein